MSPGRVARAAAGSAAAVALLLAATIGPAPAPAQAQDVGQEGDFGDLAGGPYDRLVIRGAMVIPGHGGPPTGPYDIVIQRDTIAEMIPFDPVTSARRGGTDRPTGDRVIDAEGMYVMPGMIDLHHHLRTEELPLEYTFYLKLAHGVTSTVPAEGPRVGDLVDDVNENRVLAPRLFPLWDWGEGTDYTRAQLDDPEMAPEVARAMADNGVHVVSLGDVTWSEELFGAVAQAVWDAGGITSIHLPPSTNAVVDAVDAARLGATMIEHHYGYAESALDRDVQDFPPDYDYNDENARFRHAGVVWQEARDRNEERLLGEVADSLAHYGVTMMPTRVVYEANRDITRARSLPWHDKYTHQALIEWNLPDPSHHGAYFYDWTSEDEQSWYVAFDLWGDLIYEFNERGGRVAYGTDDNYIWATAGFSNVRELQLMRESGMHPLEVIESATHNGAETLRQPRLGLVRPGYRADLAIVDGNPARNFRYMYAHGALHLNEDGEMVRTRGVVHTVKGGVVTENDLLMEAVAEMVAESREGAGENVVTEPFAVEEPR